MDAHVPYLAEIAFVGKHPENITSISGATGKALALCNSIEKILDEDQILAEIDPLFERYASERETR